ncbi:MAG TPA: hypothetical protein DCZ76_12855 [Treponema sp.]|nr:hypothetical protein [Treponema sp.]
MPLARQLKGLHGGVRQKKSLPAIHGLILLGKKELCFLFFIFLCKASGNQFWALRGICKEFTARSFATNTVEGVACCKKLYFVLGQTLSQAQGDGS